MFIPVYHSDRPEHWGFAFRPQGGGRGLACWAWVADGSEVGPGADGIDVIREPGKRSPRFAHELFFENERRDELPILVAPRLRSERS